MVPIGSPEGAPPGASSAPAARGPGEPHSGLRGAEPPYKEVSGPGLALRAPLRTTQPVEVMHPGIISTEVHYL